MGTKCTDTRRKVLPCLSKAGQCALNQFMYLKEQNMNSLVIKV